MQRSSGNGHHAFALQRGDLLGSSDVIVRAVTKAVIITLAPREHRPRSGQSDAELRAAFDLDHTQPGQRINLQRDFAAVGSSSAQFAIISIAPRPNVVIVGDTQSLGIATSYF